MRDYKFLALALVAVLFAGCRTTEKILADYESNLRAGQYLQATAEVSELAGKGGGDQLLWQLLAGGAWYMADGKDRAIGFFDKAEDAFAEADKTSVFARSGEGALAMINNETSFAYDGGGEDRVFACLYKAIDYATQGKGDAARTELNRAAQHQENWIWERRKDISSAEARLAKEAAEKTKADNADGSQRDAQVSTALNDPAFCRQIMEKTKYNPFTSGDLDRLTAQDYVNPYVQHVTGIFRWLNRDSGARELLRDARGLIPNAAVARDFAEIERGGKPSNQVWIYVEDGLCAKRAEWRLDLPMILFPGINRYVQYVGMALPYLEPREAGAAYWSVEAAGKRADLELLANVDKLIKTEYDVYMRGALKREITRALVKAGTQVALGIAAEHANDSNHRLALQIAQLSAAAWAAASTKADIRSWTSLPQTVRMQRIDRPADGAIALLADNQRIQINVPEGNTLVFVRKPSSLAMPTIKMVTFR